MLTRWNFRIIFGVLMIAGGLIFLLENLGVVSLSPLFWALAFGVAAVGFIGIYVTRRSQWWALIPGFTFAGLCASSLVDLIAPSLGESISGAIFLGGLGLSFLAIYVADRQQWWAIIPGGIMATLAAISVLDERLPEENIISPAVLFFGMGLTFLLIFLLPGKDGNRQTWAIFPALGLVVFGGLILASAAELINLVWPALLIVAGGWLTYRALFRRG